MKLNILLFKNLSLDCFTTPQFVDLTPEKAAEQLRRSIILNKEDLQKVIPYRNLVLYDFGEFDDVTGKITLLEDPEKILDCAAIIEDLGIFKTEKDA